MAMAHCGHKALAIGWMADSIRELFRLFRPFAGVSVKLATLQQDSN
jgi:hypothetical protein